MVAVVVLLVLAPHHLGASAVSFLLGDAHGIVHVICAW